MPVNAETDGIPAFSISPRGWQGWNGLSSQPRPR
jgi:hypothetical protein